MPTKSTIIVLFLVFVTWCFISIRWYVCGIKGLCESVSSELIQESNYSQETSGNLVFTYRSSRLLMNEQSNFSLDSILKLADEQDSLNIIGLYWGIENKKVGLQRAIEIKQQLQQRGLKTPSNILATPVARNDTASVFAAFKFDFIKAKEKEAIPILEIEEVAEKLIIHFPVASTNPDLHTALRDRLIRWTSKLKDQQGSLSVVGHTDNTGSSGINYTYGLRRAKEVEEILISMGISAERIESTSEGQHKPIESNETKEGRAKNRRVEIILNQP